MKLPGEKESKKGRYYKYDTSANYSSITASSTVVDLGINGSIETQGGDLLVILALPLYVDVNSVAFAQIKIDGKYHTILRENKTTSGTSTALNTAAYVISGIEAGTHSIDIGIYNSSSSANTKISPYKTISLTVVEL